jgi:hypothetical protein
MTKQAKGKDIYTEATIGQMGFLATACPPLGLSPLPGILNVRWRHGDEVIRPRLSAKIRRNLEQTYSQRILGFPRR